MDKTFYKDKLIIDHLNTTTNCKVDEREERKVMCNLKKFVEKYKKCLTPKEIKYVTDSDLKSSNFYVLPKIHKNERVLEEISMCNNIYLEMTPPIDLKARPIVAGPISATSRLSKMIDKLLSPLVQNLKSYIKDDLDLIRKLPSNIGYECDL